MTLGIVCTVVLGLVALYQSWRVRGLSRTIIARATEGDR